MSLPTLVTVAVLFLIVFGTACYTVFHLRPTPVRIAAVLLAIGGLIAAMVPIVRLLAEPQQQVAPPAAFTSASPIHRVGRGI
ncbi:hypothetical protein AB0B13_28305 [Streptomyces sp. NPDC042898]|uniref:hypothetical protein n=1 Tax=Streptomyces sp. NPDC042898 TaxID=3154334 RepID=UPI0033C74F3F